MAPAVHGGGGSRAASLPTWWLVFLNVYNIPFGFGNGLIQSLILLKTFEIAGLKDAAAFQGEMALYVSLLMHVNMGLGWWSDVGFCGKAGVRCGIGRRRPFIVAGHIMIALGVCFFAIADSLWTMVAMQVWFTLGGNFCSIPMSAIGPDQVPVHQRGTMVGIGELIQMTWGITVGSATGIYFGQLCSKNDAAGHAIGISEACPLNEFYVVSLALNVLCVPLGLMALGAEPGCCTAEIEISADDVPPAPPASTACMRWWHGVRSLAGSFLQPFSHQPFRLFFFSGFVTSISDIMYSVYQSLWFNFLISPHTVLFGRHLTAIAAGAIGGLICNIGGFVSLPIGTVLTDRCERKWVYATVVMINCQGPLIYAWNCNPDDINYTMILLSQCFSGFMGGFCNPSLGALEMDVLPQDEQGRVLHATRDQQIKGYAGFLPGLILQPVLGHAISHWPGGQEAAFREMFLGAAIFQFLGAVLILRMDLPSNVRPGEGLGPWVRKKCGAIARAEEPVSAPLGARLCDSCCFPDTSRKVLWRHELRGQKKRGLTKLKPDPGTEVYTRGSDREYRMYIDDDGVKKRKDFTAELLRLSGRQASDLGGDDTAILEGNDSASSKAAAQTMLRLRAQRRGDFSGDLRRYAGVDYRINPGP